MDTALDLGSDVNYLVAIAAMAVGLGVFVLIPRLRHWREAHTHFVDLVLVLGGTFVGVFVALDLTARQSQMAENEQMKALLSAARADVDRVGREFVSLYLAPQAVDDAGAHRLPRFPELPPRLPTVFKAVIERDLVVRRASPEGLGALQDAERELEQAHDAILRGQPHGSRALQHLTDFGYHLGYIADVLAIEDSLQRGLVAPELAGYLRGEAMVRHQGFRQSDIPDVLRSLRSQGLDTFRWREVFRTH